MTATNLIYGALRLLGVLRPGFGASTEQKADGLVALNDMLGSWNTERMAIYTIARNTYSLNAGVQAYTIGSGGTFNAARPQRIDRAGVISLAAPAQPIELPIALLTDQEWADVKVKNLQSTLPEAVYNDGAFPLSTLSFWPIPSAAIDVALYTWQALQSFADLTTDYTFPPGYSLALRFNLAAQMAPQFVLQMKTANAMIGSIEAKAAEYKGAIKSLNSPVVYMSVDPALLRRRNIFDWRTGE